MNKEKLIEVYQHTKSVCASIEVPSSKKIHFSNANYFIVEKEGKLKNVVVEPLDTVSALIKYCHKKTAVLNMASSKRKGGGVENGSQAQEECLFRCSNLFNIPDTFYPILSTEMIYTEGATFVKDANYSLIYPMVADVITLPAINLNKTHIDNLQTQDSADNYESVMTKKIESMLDVAIHHNCDNIILGAWGCGVFKNDPKTVAELFNKVIEKRYNFFDNIVFAVINDKNSVGNNYEVFSNTIKTKFE